MSLTHQIFQKLNSEPISQDSEVGLVLVDLAYKEYNKVKNQLPVNEKHEYDKKVKELCLNLSIKNWDELLSEQEHLKRQSTEAEYQFPDRYQLHDMIKRTRADQAEDRPDYVKGILSFVLDKELGGCGFLSFIGVKPNSWIALTLSYDQTIKMNKKALEKSKSYSEKKEIQEIRDNLLLVRRYMDRERNWLEKEIKKRNEKKK